MASKNSAAGRGFARVFAAALSVIMLFFVPFGASQLKPLAAEAGYDRTADIDTINHPLSWNNYIGQNVPNANAGGWIWTDKTVADGSIAMAESSITVSPQDPANFMVALSGISSLKNIIGVTSVPIDVMLVLDISSSMRTTANEGAITAMVDSANKTIETIFKMNNNNRIGIVMFDDEAHMCLELASYNYVNTELKVVPNTNEKDIEIIKNGAHYKTISAKSGTYTQGGLSMATNQFTTAVLNESRVPIMVLMSDGSPTLGTTDYTNVPDDSASISGLMSNGKGTTGLAFVTQLTAAYCRAQIEQHYQREASFYTLGFGLENLTGNTGVLARAVLDPARSTQDLESYWNEYWALPVGWTMPVTNTSTKYTLKKEADGLTQNPDYPVDQYVDQYFASKDTDDLQNVFDEILEEIELQARTYPTNTNGEDPDMSGYLHFEDAIGDYMEVKNINGLARNDEFFTGAVFSQVMAEAYSQYLNGNDGNTDPGDLPVVDSLSMAMFAAMDENTTKDEEQPSETESGDDAEDANPAEETENENPTDNPPEAENSEDGENDEIPADEGSGSEENSENGADTTEEPNSEILNDIETDYINKRAIARFDTEKEEETSEPEEDGETEDDNEGEGENSTSAPNEENEDKEDEENTENTNGETDENNSGTDNNEEKSENSDANNDDNGDDTAYAATSHSPAMARISGFEAYDNDAFAAGAPTYSNHLYEFVKSSAARLKITNIQALLLIENAFINNQIYYNSSTDYSNFVSWFGTENDTYIAPANIGDTSASAPAGATHINRSYVFFNEVDSGKTEPDIMYIGVRVKTSLATGAQTVVFTVPAALVPVVEYVIRMDRDNPNEATEANVVRNAAYPVSLFYEVGLRDDIHEGNLKTLIDSNYPYISNSGETYTFYTNAWRADAAGTTVTYTPSPENDWYYYNIDSVIYVENGGVYTPAAGQPTLDGTIYYSLSKEFFTETSSGERIPTKDIYTPLSANAIEAALLNSNTGQYYVPAGTIKSAAFSNAFKKQNISGVYENPTQTNDFICNFTPPQGTAPQQANGLLGNNGLLRLDITSALEVEKTVTGAGDKNRDFSFTVTLSDTTLNGQHGDMFFTNGVAQFTLKHGQTALALDIPSGTTYTVTEENYSSDGYTTTHYNADGTIDKHIPAHVKFENNIPMPPSEEFTPGEYTSPITGDSSNTSVWVALCIISLVLIAAAGAYFFVKRRK